MLFLSLGLINRVRNTSRFQSSFNCVVVSFFMGHAAILVLEIMVALLMLAALWFMKHDRPAFFFVKGQMDAPIEPVRWLGIKAGESWKIFGWIFAGVAGLGVAIPTIPGNAPPGETILKALLLLPVALANLLGEHTPDPELMMAGSVITILPVLIVFMVLQKYYIQGIMLGGVKE